MNLSFLGKTSLFLSCLFAVAVETRGQTFDVGFKIITLYDSSRTYKPNTSTDDPLHFRRIDIDLWYPAQVGDSDSMIRFGDLIHLMEARAKLYDDTQDYTGLSDELLQYLCLAIGCSDHNLLRTRSTASASNPKEVLQSSPLILYFAAINGMSYENHLLFEALARKGFTVASISSIGRYPGNMTTAFEDVNEQAEDGKYALEFLKKSPRVSDTIALLGYSWGSIAATLLAKAQPETFSAFVSLDGSEHEAEYGTYTKKAMRENIGIPYLYLHSEDREIRPHDNAVPSNFVKVSDATHEDFSIFSNRTIAKTIRDLATTFLLQHCKGLTEDTRRTENSLVQRKISMSNEDMPTNIRGRVADAKTRLPLAYVNIGIPGKDIGTVSDTAGNFTLTIRDVMPSDTLRFSMVGYENQEIQLANWDTRRKELFMKEHAVELAELTITAKGYKKRTFGNTAKSKFFGGKFSSEDFGSELAIRVHAGRRIIQLKSFQFNISYNTEDSAVFRFNLYTVKDGSPDVNILSENIFISVRSGQTGKISCDLSKHNIIITDDFFIGLEYIDGSKNSGIVFSAGFVNNPTYYRKASQSRWRKYPMGVGFSVLGEF